MQAVASSGCHCINAARSVASRVFVARSWLAGAVYLATGSIGRNISLPHAATASSAVSPLPCTDGRRRVMRRSRIV